MRTNNNFFMAFSNIPYFKKLQQEVSEMQQHISQITAKLVDKTKDLQDWAECFFWADENKNFWTISNNKPFFSYWSADGFPVFSLRIENGSCFMYQNQKNSLAKDIFVASFLGDPKSPTHQEMIPILQLATEKLNRTLE